MTDIDRNPMAFPRQLDGDELHIMPTQYGMSLRDYFAAKALSATIPSVLSSPSDAMGPAEHIALLVYQLADAMLSERAKATSTEGASA